MSNKFSVSQKMQECINYARDYLYSEHDATQLESFVRNLNVAEKDPLLKEAIQHLWQNYNSFGDPPDPRKEAEQLVISALLSIVPTLSKE